MNEKNKNEKTFADLFSTISEKKENKTSDSNNEKTTLNDLFNQKTEETNILNLNTKEEDNVLNFESPSTEKKDEINFNNILINSERTKHQEENEKKFDLFDFNNNQEKAIETSNKDQNKNTSLEEKLSKQETKEEANQETKNEENNIFVNSNQFEEQIEEQENSIEFEEKTENIFLKEEVNNKENNNIFTNLDKEEKEKENNAREEEQYENNMFFNVEENNQESEETNMFIDSDTVEGQQLDKEKNNIFLNELKTETEIIENDDNEKELELSPSNAESEPEESPFFSDTDSTKDSIQESENPFFENKINLIENQKLSNENTTIDTSNIKHFNVKVVNKKEPLIKFIIGVISYAIFILLLLIGITLLVYVADLKIKEAKGDTTPPKYNAFVVLTGSMLPEIQVYDVVVTKKINTEDLKEGDVITFSSSDSRFAGTTITHRIIKINKPNSTNINYTFQTKGDNNNVADSALVQANNIYGKVIFKIPKLGYLQEFLASDGGWILVILLPCLAVVSYDIVTLAKGIKRKKYKKLKVQK